MLVTCSTSSNIKNSKETVCLSVSRLWPLHILTAKGIYMKFGAQENYFLEYNIAPYVRSYWYFDIIITEFTLLC